MDPLRPSSRASVRARSPGSGADSDSDASPSRRVRPRTAHPGTGPAGFPPPRSAAGESAASTDANSPTRPPRAAVPLHRSPHSAHPAAPSAADTAASSSAGPGTGSPAREAPGLSAWALEAPGRLEQELAALGLQGPPSRAHFLALVLLAAQRPDLESRIQKATTALSLHQGTGPEVEAVLRPLWLTLQLVGPAGARVIEHILNPAGVIENDGASSDDEAPGLDDDPGSLEEDLERLGAPLGHQIQAWLGDAARAATADPHVFDDEEGAPAFARMLERLQQEVLPEATPAARNRVEAQVKAAIMAMARDTALRGEVFLISQTALGDCRDNLLEGFSKVMLAVRNRQMLAAVRSGRMDEGKLHLWTGQQFRLALLETATGQLIGQLQQQGADLPPWDRDRLQSDPLETLADAKAQLKRPLGLPQDTIENLTSNDMSVLQPQHIEALRTQVLQQAADPQSFQNFLLEHDTWRTCMQALHPAIFQPLVAARDADPFHDMDPPDDLESPAAFAYAQAGRKVYEDWQASVQQALASLAEQAGGALPPPPPPRPPQDPGSSSGAAKPEPAPPG